MDLFSAVREAGYSLSEDDVACVCVGLGTNGKPGHDAKIDKREFLTVCDDIARECAAMKMQSQNADATVGHDADLWADEFGDSEESHGRGHGRGQRHGHGKSGGIESELCEQMTLLGFGAGHSVEAVAEALTAPFRSRDLMAHRNQLGVVSRGDLCGAVREIGLHLSAREIDELVARFGVAHGRGHDSNGRDAESGLTEYGPLVTLLLEACFAGSEQDGGHGHGGHGHGHAPSNAAPSVPAELRDLASRLRQRLMSRAGVSEEDADSDGHNEGLTNGLRAVFDEIDADGSGAISRAEFSRALSMIGLADALSDADATCLLGVLDQSGDGRVDWPEFISFVVGGGGEGGTSGMQPHHSSARAYSGGEFESEYQGGGGRGGGGGGYAADRRDERGYGGGSDYGGGGIERDPRDDVHATPWFVIESTFAERLLRLMEQRAPAQRRGFVGELRRLFRSADVNGDGYLDRFEFARVLSEAGVSIGSDELDRLLSSLDVNADGRVSYAELVNFLLSHIGDWHRAERDIAKKLALAMGADPASRRAWLGRLRARFFSADRFRTGALGDDELIQVLRELSVGLSRAEEARLLSALRPDQGSARDVDGGVAYGELLRFCQRNVGAWHEADPSLAARLRGALAAQLRPWAWIADLRRLFRSLDRDGNGYLDRREFEDAMRRIGLGGLDLADTRRLMDLLDGDGDGRVSYRALVEVRSKIDCSNDDAAHTDCLSQQPENQLSFDRLRRVPLRVGRAVASLRERARPKAVSRARVGRWWARRKWSSRRARTDSMDARSLRARRRRRARRDRPSRVRGGAARAQRLPERRRVKSADGDPRCERRWLRLVPRASSLHAQSAREASRCWVPGGRGRARRTAQPSDGRASRDAPSPAPSSRDRRRATHRSRLGRRVRPLS